MTETQLIGNTDPVLALTVAYNGASFAGFARQPQQQTVQGALEYALETVYRRPVHTTGAGRTDAGVHALGNVVSFALSKEELAERSLGRLQHTLNALTPEGLTVRQLAEKPADFSARFSAKSREYRYRVYPSRIPPVFLAPFVWWHRASELDVTAMRAAASFFEGEHDFKSFCVAKSAGLGPTQRFIERVMIFGTQHLGEQCVVVQVVGNAFLHSMVRVMVGSLMEVGLRRRPPEWIAEVLEAQDRQAAGETAPAQGLTLWRVRY